MKYKQFGKTGTDVSEVGMGTYYDPLWVATAFLGWRRGARRKVDAMMAGLETGINMIDTAEIYGSEPLVRQAIAGKKRDDLFIATKVWPNHLGRKALKRALEKSLRRLGLSHVDLYQVHWPSKSVPIGEAMAAMEDMVEAGKTRFVGVSNFSLEQIKEANSALRKSQLTSVQLPYNLINRKVEEGILPYCQREGIALMAYIPLAHGKLVSSQRLVSMCEKYHKTPSQLSVKWLARQEGVFPIPRASIRSHVMENAAASDFEISGEDAAELERVYA